MASETVTRVPERQDVPAAHKWDLAKLYSDDQAFESDLKEFASRLDQVEKFQGTLGKSAKQLLACLEFMTDIGRQAERLGSYASLRMSENAGDGKNQERYSRFVQIGAKMETLASYQAPEIQAIPEETMKDFLSEEMLASYRIYLNKLLRFKPHVLSQPEERLLAMQEETNEIPTRAFGALTDVDMDFGTVHTPEGDRPLTQSSYGSLMLHTDRSVRKEAFEKFMAAFDSHKNTISSLYAGSVQMDIYHARARNFSSALHSRLFPDDVPQSVYENLIRAVHENLPALHKYYDIRARALGVPELRLYDTRVPLVADIDVRHSYDQAVGLVIEALSPLGSDYTTTLKAGLLGGWVDRFENKGKRSGAFSAGSFVGDPYILMNFKEDDLRDVFTLAHESGHSMHSWYSVRNNPFQHYHYTIFEAEVASTFNEQLLLDYLLKRAHDERMRAFLVNKHVDDIIGTLYRQTMFAEFEKRTHAMVESGVPLTVDSLRSEYHTLLGEYFGPRVAIEELADLEGLRIPHFYRAFYVYKYATGISAAITLAQKVLSGEANAIENYFTFLKSGGSRFPIESLKIAGVDMTKPEAVNAALRLFADRVEELDGLLR